MKFERSMSVPMPAWQEAVREGRVGRPTIYPFADLKIGESILIPGKKSASSLSSSIQTVRKRTGFEFTTRKEDGGVRVWRTV